MKGETKKKQKFVYCSGRSVIIRDLANPLLCDQYTEHSNTATVAAFSPSSFYIASGDEAGNVRIWDTINSEHVLKLKLEALSGPVYDIAWSQDSQRLVVGGEGREAFGQVYLVDSGSTAGTIDGHGKTIISVDFRPTRPFRVVTASEDTQVNFFAGPPFKFSHAIKKHTKFVNCVRYDSKGTLFASVGSDMNIFLFEGKDGQPVKDIEQGHKGSIWSLSWGDEGTQFMTSSADKTVKIWDVETCKEVTSFNFSSLGFNGQQMGTLWMGGWALSLGLDGNINYLDPRSGKVTQTIFGHNKNIKAIKKNKNKIYSGDYEGNLRVWEYDYGSLSTDNLNKKPHENQIAGIESFVENSLHTLGWDDKIVQIDTNTGETISETPLDSQPIGFTLLKEEGILTLLQDSSIAVVKDGKVVTKIPVTGTPTCIDVNHETENLAIGFSDSTVRVFSICENALELIYEIGAGEHKGEITDIKFSPSGKYIASCDAQRQICVWKEKELVASGWCFHSSRVTCLAWSSDEIHLASGSTDGHVIVWNVNSPLKRIKIANAHLGGVNSVEWYSVNVLITAGNDFALKTWSIEF